MSVAGHNGGPPEWVRCCAATFTCPLCTAVGRSAILRSGTRCRQCSLEWRRPAEDRSGRGLEKTARGYGCRLVEVCWLRLRRCLHNAPMTHLGNRASTFRGCEGDALLILDANGVECSTEDRPAAGVAQPHVLVQWASTRPAPVASRWGTPVLRLMSVPRWSASQGGGTCTAGPP